MKLPPIEKIPEAWSALADSRVSLDDGVTAGEGSATVESSDGKRSYRVTWREGGKVFTSSDPATFWQGYPGYPVLAVMMRLGMLPLWDGSGLYAGVNWHEINARFRRDYAAALAYVNEERNIDKAASAYAAGEVSEALTGLGVTLKRK